MYIDHITNDELDKKELVEPIDSVRQNSIFEFVTAVSSNAIGEKPFVSCLYFFYSNVVYSKYITLVGNVGDISYYTTYVACFGNT